MGEAGHAIAPKPPALDTRGRVEARDDIVAGDEILFYEEVWNKRSRARVQTPATPVGYRVIVAQVVWESYGPEKAKHSLTLRVRESSGSDPIRPGKVIWRKNMQVSHNRCWRLRRSGEMAGELGREEKPFNIPDAGFKSKPRMPGLKHGATKRFLQSLNRKLANHSIDVNARRVKEQ